MGNGREKSRLTRSCGDAETMGEGWIPSSFFLLSSSPYACPTFCIPNAFPLRSDDLAEEDETTRDEERGERREEKKKRGSKNADPKPAAPPIRCLLLEWLESS